MATAWHGGHVDMTMTSDLLPRLRPPRHLVSRRAIGYWTLRAALGWLVPLVVEAGWLLGDTGNSRGWPARPPGAGSTSAPPGPRPVPGPRRDRHGYRRRCAGRGAAAVAAVERANARRAPGAGDAACPTRPGHRAGRRAVQRQ